MISHVVKFVIAVHGLGYDARLEDAHCVCESFNPSEVCMISHTYPSTEQAVPIVIIERRNQKKWEPVHSKATVICRKSGKK